MVLAAVVPLKQSWKCVMSLLQLILLRVSIVRLYYIQLRKRMLGMSLCTDDNASFDGVAHL